MDKNEFIKEVKQICGVAIKNCDKLLQPFDVNVSINWEYDFNSKDWQDAIGVYEHDSVLEGTISIGCNLKSLYNSFTEQCNHYPFTNEYTILNEIIFTNVYHEVGHGLCNLFEEYEIT